MCPAASCPREVDVEQTEMIALIRGGVPAGGLAGGTWADLGAGTGNFTSALRSLLAPTSAIYAVERDADSLRRLHATLAREPIGAFVHGLHADFTRPLDLPPLDGVLMANSLHFNRDQATVLARVAGYLRPGGRLVLVEYDLRVPRPWVPFPVPFARFEKLATAIGLRAPVIVGTRKAAWSDRVMYAAAAANKN